MFESDTAVGGVAFNLAAGKLLARAFCNLHGLWQAEELAS